MYVVQLYIYPEREHICIEKVRLIMNIIQVVTELKL